MIYSSGTAIHSNVKDLVSPLKIAWNLLGLDAIPTAPTPEMYENTYDPYISGGLFESVDMECETMRAIKGAYDQSGVRLWVLNPDWYVSLGAQYHYSGVFARVVSRAVLEDLWFGERSPLISTTRTWLLGRRELEFVCLLWLQLEPCCAARRW